MTLGADHPHVTALAVDPSGTYAYAATSKQDLRVTMPDLSSHVLRIRLSDFVMAGALTLPKGENLISSILISPSGQEAYLGTYGDPNTDRAAQVIRVNLSDFVHRAAAPLEAGTFGLTTGVLNRSGKAAYWGTQFGFVTGISLPDLGVLGSVSMGRQSNAFQASVADPKGRFAYFGSSSGSLLQLDVATWTPTATLSLLLRSEPGFTGGVIDHAGQHTYWITGGEPARVVSVSLQPFKPGNDVLLKSEEKEGLAVFLDESASLLYAVVQGPPAAVVRIQLPSMKRVDAQPFPSFGKVTAVTYDAKRRALYAAMGSSPARIVQMDMSIPDATPSKSTSAAPENACSADEGCNESLQRLP